MRERRNFVNALIVLALSVFVQTSFAQSFMANIPGRQSLSLNGKWSMITDWYGRGEGRKVYLDEPVKSKSEFHEYYFSDQQTLMVPSDWNSQKPFLQYYEGTVWYRKEFKYQPKPNQRTFLHFGGVNYKCKVYLNGRLLGAHEGGFTPFQFEITDVIKPGTNKLIVSVDNRRSEDAIPAQNYDWWNYGGITRDVNVITTPTDYISDYFVQLKRGTRGVIEGWIKLNGSKTAEKVTISIPEAKVKQAVQTNTDGIASFVIKTDLQLWSPQNPKLYEVKITSSSDSIKERIGFRDIEVKGDDILLNGKPVFLKGVSFHEEIAGRQGRAATEQDAIQILQQAKQLGCNFIRTAHYPQNEYIVRLAEKMGLMVWEEIPIWQGIDFKDPVILDKARLMMKDMITRDKNRCGIIIWSLSNETAPSPDRNKVLKQLAATARSMDSTRLLSSAFNHFKQEGAKLIIDDPLSEDLDVVAANKYFGWYESWPAEPGNVVWELEHKKPLIISEFGAEALYGRHGTPDSANLWNEEYQERVMKDDVKMFTKNPEVKGVCAWVLFDFRSPTRMQSVYQNGWNRKGLLSDKGEKKKAWYVIHDFYKSR